METALHFYLFFGALFALVISIGMLLQKQKEVINYIYAFSFFGLAFWLLQMSLYTTGVYDAHPFSYHVKAACIPFAFGVPPLMAYRYRWIITHRLAFHRGFWLLFIPALFSAFYVLLPLFFESIQVNHLYLAGKPVLSPEFDKLPPYFKGLYLLFPLSKIFLVITMLPTLVSMTAIWKKAPSNRGLTLSRAGYVFLALICFCNALSALGDFVSIELVKISLALANTEMTILYLVTQRHGDYNRLLRNETRRACYERSLIKGLDWQKIVERLFEIMEEEKAFADEELTLGRLAEDLGITSHQLSQILNERLKKNFNTFVNEFRVREARKLLVEEKDRSILSVGFAVGFNSNTTFNTVFSKLTGVTPGKYRKLHG